MSVLFGVPQQDRDFTPRYSPSVNPDGAATAAQSGNVSATTSSGGKNLFVHNRLEASFDLKTPSEATVDLIGATIVGQGEELEGSNVTIRLDGAEALVQPGLPDFTVRLRGASRRVFVEIDGEFVEFGTQEKASEFIEARFDNRMAEEEEMLRQMVKERMSRIANVRSVNFDILEKAKKLKGN